jgi:hypothetical protein
VASLLAAHAEEESIDHENPYERDNFLEALTDGEIIALGLQENYQFEQR